jgi:RsiW-degrading membrane proteinase PrsW (M82 family)
MFIINFAFSFLPVLLFLACLFLLDRFRLVEVKTLLLCLVWGILSVLIILLFNTLISNWIEIDFQIQTRYVAPVVEELIKGVVILYLLRKKRIGFLVDAVIYGFATGAGFALMENVLYLFTIGSDATAGTWIVRGIGTAIMHGGCTGLLALISITAITRDHQAVPATAYGLVLAVILHSGFNHFVLPPLIQTLVILTVFPTIFILLLILINKNLSGWLEIEFSSEVEILSMIRKGALKETRAGRYLLSIRERFSHETVVDLYCYLNLYLELSIKAKRNLMLKENGIKPPYEADLSDKLNELRHIRKRIGPIGEAAISPLIRMNYRDLWKLNQLRQK